MSKSPKFIKQLNTKKLNILVVLGVVFLWMFTLVSSNYANHQNLRRNDLDQNIKSLEEKIRLLDAEASELQTTRRLEEESQRLNLVKVQTGDIFYVNYSDGAVALK